MQIFADGQKGLQESPVSQLESRFHCGSFLLPSLQECKDKQQLKVSSLSETVHPNPDVQIVALISRWSRFFCLKRFSVDGQGDPTIIGKSAYAQTSGPIIIRTGLVFWIPRCGFRVPGAGFRIFCQWNLDYGFLEMNSGFTKFRIPDSTSRNLPDSGFLKRRFLNSRIRISLHGARLQLYAGGCDRPNRPHSPMRRDRLNTFEDDY